MTAREIAERWERRARGAKGEIERGLTQAAKLIQATSRFEMNRLIYAHPPDLKRDGQPRWKQTRRLYEAERAVPGLAGQTVVVTNSMAYARARHELGRDGRKTSRPAHWRDEARELMQREFRDQIEARLIANLERP